MPQILLGFRILNPINQDQGIPETPLLFMRGVMIISPMVQKFFINTFGCQMNVADTERMTALLSDAGMEPSDVAEDADVIIVNGCSIREKAVHKAVSALGRYQSLQTRGRKPLIGLGGCVGELEKDSLFEKAPYLDFVFGTDAIDELPEIIHRVNQGERQIVYTGFDSSSRFSTETRILGRQAQAYVNIMKGCDKYCTYCIVPFTRGREKSRTIDEVVDDIASLVKKGVREVTLLGQNVNSFGKGNPNHGNRIPLSLNNVIGKVGPSEGEENFPQLLRAIDRDPRSASLRRLRFTSSHPLDFSDELIECYAPFTGVSRLANHLHLPVQSGSNQILHKMGRRHSIESYISQMDHLRQVRPDVALSTDLIVGFPTETNSDFQLTLDLLDRLQYDNIFAFVYSSRPGTRAAQLKDDVPHKLKKDRLNVLLDKQREISRKKYLKFRGRTTEILTEGLAKNQKLSRFSKNSHVWMGRTSCNRVVNFQAGTERKLKGQFVKVKITNSACLSLTGELM